MEWRVCSPWCVSSSRELLETWKAWWISTTCDRQPTGCLKHESSIGRPRQPLLPVHVLLIKTSLGVKHAETLSHFRKMTTFEEYVEECWIAALEMNPSIFVHKCNEVKKTRWWWCPYNEDYIVCENISQINFYFNILDLFASIWCGVCIYKRDIF